MAPRRSPENKAPEWDRRALRFALTFPVLLSVALIVGSLLTAPQLPNGIVLPWGGEAVSVPIFLALGVAVIVLVGAGVGSLGAQTTFSPLLRRTLLGVAMTLQLSAFTLWVAALLGQGASGGLPPQRVDGFVVLMGCGLAAAMGLVLAMTFKPQEQWSPADDAALAALADPMNPADPMETVPTEQAAFKYFLHPRSSVVIMLLLVALLPGALLALLSPWILVVLVLAALTIIALLCATVTSDDAALTVKVLGWVPVIVVPHTGVLAAVALENPEHGGWGLRKRPGSASYLTGSGAAVVLREHDGARTVISAPNLALAQELAETVNRQA